MSRSESLVKIRDQLERRRRGLMRALRGDLSLLGELHHDRTGDVLDAAADTIQEELNSQVIESESRELVAINEAIERFDSGTFGVCESCDRSIPLTRLRAVPYATTCISCQRAAERPLPGTSVLWNRVFDAASAEAS